jgi:outer membrane protein
MTPARLRGVVAGLCLAGLPAFGISSAMADDLRTALTSAYNTNPDLQAARAQLRAIDENVPLTRAQALPSLTGSVNYNEYVDKGGSSFSTSYPDRVLGVNATAGLPLYRGGAVKNGLRAAETRVEAGRASLRGTESSVFTSSVGAYMDVIRDAAIVGLQKNNVQVLEVNLQATSDRFEIGDVTRTDVAQSRSRLALARAGLRSAEANLVASREAYVRIIGHAPGTLENPPALAGMPATVDDAVDYALDNNPDLQAAREASKAAGFDVKVAGASRLPTVSASATSSSTNYLSSFNPGVPNSSRNMVAGLTASIPLFQGGAPAARVRQAQASQSVTLEQEIGTERAVIATVRSAWSAWLAAKEVIALNQTAVDAAALSLEGVRAENTVGNRTILNILDAEQELLNAQVQLVTAQRNEYVAGFALLSAMGRAQAKDLGLDGGALYDPVANYERVHHRIWDWDSDPTPVARSTPTVDTPAQDATIPDQPLP